MSFGSGFAWIPCVGLFQNEQVPVSSNLRQLDDITTFAPVSSINFINLYKHEGEAPYESPTFTM